MTLKGLSLYHAQLKDQGDTVPSEEGTAAGLLLEHKHFFYPVTRQSIDSRDNTVLFAAEHVSRGKSITKSERTGAKQ